ncbi:hypothetical protein [Sphingomonas profundi]|uniref:hypothetical protein n=1 Tax=Alterirhizorhabdus profundi TaxID=2681549 RepID=UPI0012E7FD83|nr:hypothetical protein [Sphingomonas profundi]
MSADTGMEAERAAASPPIGISSRQIFVVALLAIAGWLAVSAWIITHSADASDRAAILQSAINIATTAFGFYLGSSASSRNKDHRP